MKIALIILIIVITLIVVMVLIGKMLPVKHIASQSMSFQSSCDEVWKVVSNVNEWKSWRSDLKEITITGDSTVKADDVEYAISNAVPGVSFTTTIITKDLPYGGAWNYVFEKDGSGCKLTITENGEVYNPLFRFLSKFAFGHEGTLKKYMETLAKRMK